METGNLEVRYPVNVLNWLGVPILNLDMQYDRIDDVLNAITKGYNPDNQQIVKDVFIARFVVGLSYDEIEGRVVCNSGRWNAERLMTKLHRDICHNQYCMDYLKLLRNSYQNKFEKLNCDIRDAQITAIPAQSRFYPSNIWGVPDAQWRVVESFYYEGMPIKIISQEMSLSQNTVRKMLHLAVDLIRTCEED